MNSFDKVHLQNVCRQYEEPRKKLEQAKEIKERLRIPSQNGRRCPQNGRYLAEKFELTHCKLSKTSD